MNAIRLYDKEMAEEIGLNDKNEDSFDEHYQVAKLKNYLTSVYVRQPGSYSVSAIF